MGKSQTAQVSVWIIGADDSDQNQQRRGKEDQQTETEVPKKVRVVPRGEQGSSTMLASRDDWRDDGRLRFGETTHHTDTSLLLLLSSFQFNAVKTCLDVRAVHLCSSRSQWSCLFHWNLGR
jgi:hypothetical protein